MKKRFPPLLEEVAEAAKSQDVHHVFDGLVTLVINLTFLQTEKKKKEK